MFGARQRDIDSIGALNKFGDCQSSTEYDQGGLPAFKKPIEPSRPSSNEPEFLTKEIITIFASWPWKVSTVPIRIYVRS